MTMPDMTPGGPAPEMPTIDPVQPEIMPPDAPDEAPQVDPGEVPASDPRPHDAA